jgi:hypothetical protein
MKKGFSVLSPKSFLVLFLKNELLAFSFLPSTPRPKPACGAASACGMRRRITASRGLIPMQQLPRPDFV